MFMLFMNRQRYDRQRRRHLGPGIEGGRSENVYMDRLSYSFIGKSFHKENTLTVIF